MRLLNSLLLLAAAVLPALTIAATNPNARAKFTDLAITSKSKTSGLIPLTNALYDELITAPRNYTAVVLLTALDSKYGCHMCKEFQPQYELVAKSWLKKHKNADGLFLTVLDFGVGKETFMKLGLNTAPVLHLFPPTVGAGADPTHAKDPYSYDFLAGETKAESITRFIAAHSPHSPVIVRPFDYAKAATVVGSVLLSLSVLKIAYPTLKPAIYSRNLWAAISLILILLFTSGHMFNHIRGVPYVVSDRNGGISYVAGGFSNQYGLETQIVAVIYAVLAFCAISLGMKMPTIQDPGRQKFAVWAWNGVLLIAFSFLMSLFRQKNGGYPFKLPPMM